MISMYNTSANNVVTNFYDYDDTNRKKEKKFSKNERAFNSHEGACYIDRNEKEYTYQDLYNICLDEEGTDKLFEELHFDTLEESLDKSWYFSKCKRCGNWIYKKDAFSLMRDKKRPLICNFCVPLKTMGIIHLENNPYDDDRNFFHKKKVKFQTGVTTLIGCNGIGKSTLLKNIKWELEACGTPCLFFDNMSHDGGGQIASTMLSRALMGNGSMDQVAYSAGLFSQSEGERIKSALLNFSNEVLDSLKYYEGFGEYWVLFDAIDSGLSLDVLEDVKQYLFRYIIESIPDDKDVYIVCSSNSYEFSENTQMFSVEKMRYTNIKSYTSYKKAIKSSMNRKAKRDDVFRIKGEIYSIPCDWNIDEEAIELFNHGHGEVVSDMFMAICGDYKMTLNIARKDHKTRKNITLEKMVDGAYTRLPCKDFEGVDTWHLRVDEIKKDMHEYICRRIFLDTQKRKNNTETKFGDISETDATLANM